MSCSSAPLSEEQLYNLASWPTDNSGAHKKKKGKVVEMPEK